MEDIDATLWALEEQFWLGGPDVYRRHLTENALMVFPGMVLTKAQTVESIAAGSRWLSVNFTDRRVVRLTSDSAALVYRATAVRFGEKSSYSATISSLYVKQQEAWKLGLHQQSPFESK